MSSSIRLRTFCYFAFGMLILILAFSLLFFPYFYSVYKERMESDQIRTTSGTAQSVSTLLMNIKQNAYFLCSNDELASKLTSTGKSEGMTQRDFALQRDTINTIFSVNTGTPTAPLMQSAQAVLLLAPQFPLSKSTIQGTFSLGESITQQHVYSALDVQDSAWYQQTISLKGQIHTFRHEDKPGSVFFSQLLRSTRIADPRYNENIGVVLYVMPERSLLSILAKARISPGTIALLTLEDQVFLSSAPDLFPQTGGEAADASTLLSLLPQEGKIAQIKAGKTGYAASSLGFQGNWRFVLLVPNADLYHYVSTPLTMLLPILLLFLTIAALVSLLLSRQLMRPIITLSEAMVQVQESKRLPSRVPEPPSRDEIAVLYHSYNAMIEQIDKLSEQTAQEAEKLRVAELKTMQAQINPHFIYNTLDSISCSALLEGNDDIVTMVTALNRILKYSVNFSRTSVPLREEIDYLQQYIRIQKLRFKNGFDFICDVPEAYLSVRVSQIILQPLVENALFHAKHRGKALKIRLYCEVAGNRLRIHVTDNGSGGDAAALNRMLQSEEEEDSHGIGIRNVNKRMRLLTGGEGGLHYEQLENEGLDAVIQIPL